MSEDQGLEVERAAWRARQRRLRRLQDVGLVLLALGVLLLAYAALAVGGR